MTTVETKYCPDCDRDLPVSEFYKNRSQVDGLQRFCKTHSSTRAKAWRENQDPEQFRQDNIRRNRVWRKRNLEHRRVIRANKRARERGLPATLTLSEWTLILDRYGRLCAYCSGEFKELDHLIPLEAGGGTTANNVVPCCTPCNRKKSAMRVAIVREAYIYGYVDGYLKALCDSGSLDAGKETQIRSEIASIFGASELLRFAGFFLPE